MKISDVPFSTVDWLREDVTVHPGEQGFARWRTRQFGEIRVRLIDYSPGYVADHWCRKGHVLFVMDGELVTELDDGRTVVLRPGMSYQVADQAEAHRSRTDTGARLFVVD